MGTKELIKELTRQLREANEVIETTDKETKHVLIGYAAGLAYAIVKAKRGCKD